MEVSALVAFPSNGTTWPKRTSELLYMLTIFSKVDAAIMAGKIVPKWLIKLSWGEEGESESRANIIYDLSTATSITSRKTTMATLSRENICKRNGSKNIFEDRILQWLLEASEKCGCRLFVSTYIQWMSTRCASVEVADDIIETNWIRISSASRKQK